jgi:hypothetical protein
MNTENNQPSDETPARKAPIYLIGVDDEMRARLKKEHLAAVNMRTIKELAQEEYQRLTRQEWRTFWLNSLKERDAFGGNDAA